MQGVGSFRTQGGTQISTTFFGGRPSRTRSHSTAPGFRSSICLQIHQIKAIHPCGEANLSCFEAHPFDTRAIVPGPRNLPPPMQRPSPQPEAAWLDLEFTVLPPDHRGETMARVGKWANNLISRITVVECGPTGIIRERESGIPERAEDTSLLRIWR